MAEKPRNKGLEEGRTTVVMPTRMFYLQIQSLSITITPSP
jgi:hypothetical protein